MGDIYFCRHTDNPTQILVFAIYNLCAYPEHIGPLREEIERMMNAPTEERFTNMPLLDSFLRETARLNPLEASQFPPCHSSSQ